MGCGGKVGTTGGGESVGSSHGVGGVVGKTGMGGMVGTGVGNTCSDVGANCVLISATWARWVAKICGLVQGRCGCPAGRV